MLVHNGDVVHCAVCRRQSRKVAAFVRGRCAGSAATRWADRAAADAQAGIQIGGGHQRRMSGEVVWCSRCGAYASSLARGLMRACLGPPAPGGNSGGRAWQLRRLKKGFHPVSGARLPPAVPEIHWATPAGRDSGIGTWMERRNSIPPAPHPPRPLSPSNARAAEDGMVIDAGADAAGNSITTRSVAHPLTAAERLANIRNRVAQRGRDATSTSSPRAWGEAAVSSSAKRRRVEARPAALTHDTCDEACNSGYQSSNVEPGDSSTQRGLNCDPVTGRLAPLRLTPCRRAGDELLPPAARRDGLVAASQLGAAGQQCGLEPPRTRPRLGSGGMHGALGGDGRIDGDADALHPGNVAVQSSLVGRGPLGLGLKRSHAGESSLSRRQAGSPPVTHRPQEGATNQSAGDEPWEHATRIVRRRAGSEPREPGRAEGQICGSQYSSRASLLAALQCGRVSR